MDDSNPLTDSELKSRSAIVLIVDDNPATAEFLVLALQPHYRTFSAFSGEDAIGFCVSHVPDLVILDLHMDGLGGLLTCKMLRAIPGMAKCPIVFATADTSTEQEVNCWDAGATDFITKPFVMKSLIKRVQSHIQAKLQSDLIENTAFIDQQTNLYNRRYFNINLAKHLSLAERNDGPLSMVLFELTNDKLFEGNKEIKISENHLTLVTTLISDNLTRPTDILTRYSSNEFAILLPDTFIFGGKHIIQRVLTAFNELDINDAALGLKSLKLYAGMSSTNQLSKNTTLNEQAEKNLSQNKQSPASVLASYY